MEHEIGATESVPPMYRSMREEDVPQVVALERLAFSTPWNEGSFLRELRENPLARYVVAVVGSQVVGYGGMWVLSHLGEAYVTNIAVHPAFRRQGFGEGIVRRLLERARRERVRVVSLEVRRSNLVAQKLYRKLGFRFVGVRPHYYEDDGEDAFLMEVHLSVWIRFVEGGE